MRPFSYVVRGRVSWLLLVITFIRTTGNDVPREHLRDAIQNHTQAEQQQPELHCVVPGSGHVPTAVRPFLRYPDIQEINWTQLPRANIPSVHCSAIVRDDRNGYLCVDMHFGPYDSSSGPNHDESGDEGRTDARTIHIRHGAEATELPRETYERAGCKRERPGLGPDAKSGASSREPTSSGTKTDAPRSRRPPPLVPDGILLFLAACFCWSLSEDLEEAEFWFTQGVMLYWLVITLPA